ncbi:hypothetical protein BpHYR1_003722 [Brachionus plicatilis]|uniref:Uncharacterized protein n=1 Tax=Brachionus plicatilis TaxID=10195 RepID=A0A3M7QT85_BRAPC|nr:hypothetical protein BpHYR1_003722 [Brachionus plicatilis]
MNSERLGLTKSVLKLDENTYLQPRMILRDNQDPVQVRIRVKKPSKGKSLERPVCFRVKDGRTVDPSSICAPLRISSKPRPCVPREPAYEVAPVVYLNADGTAKGCSPNEPSAETAKDPDCGCPVESSVEKTFTQGGSEDEPLVIRIGPSGDFSGDGCEEKPVYKINFKDNVMNVTSNIDFLVKKLERTKSSDDKDADVQKYLIKPISKNFPPVTVTVRPNPAGNQSVTVNESSSDEESKRTQSVPNEYAEPPAQTRTRTVQPTMAPQQQTLYTPEQLAAAYQQQQAVVPTQQAVFTPEQLAAAYQEQQSGQAEFKVSPEQLAAAYKEQQAANPGAPQYQFSPEQLASAYQQQQAGLPPLPQAGAQQQAPAPTQYAQPGAQPQAYAYPQQQVPAQTQYAQPGQYAQQAAYPQQQAYAYPQQQAPAPTQYAQPGAQPQAYAYPQQQAPAPTQYAQPGAQPQAYAYPQQQVPAQTQYAQPGVQQPTQQPFQFSQFPPQVAA